MTTPITRKLPLSVLEGAVLGLLRDENTGEFRIDLDEPTVASAFEDMLDTLKGNWPEDELEQLLRHILVLSGADILGTSQPVTKDHTPWLKDIKTEINWRRWHAYRKMLSNSGRSGLVLQKLDQFTDTVLDLVGNPQDQGTWNRRGLLIGDVQSGKTQNYVALMNKAVDAGFRLIIVLSGNTEYLRRQTQERVDEGFIGRDTAGASKLGNARIAKDPYVGIGKLDHGIANATSMTTVLMDFLEMTKKGTSIPMPTDSSAPLVFVVKKNKFVLEAVDGWAKDQAGKGKIGFPLLLLDDESDYASINTRESDDPTAINSSIRKILSRFERSSYLAITATPFANIFIDDTAAYNNEGQELPDLFPEDYIFPLEAPTNYVGIQSVFGDPTADKTPGLHFLDDADKWIPFKHKKDHKVGPIPESLRESIRCFLIINTLMDLRIKMPKRRSMLINVSRFTNVQNTVAELISNELYAIKSAVELHSHTYANGRSNAILDGLRTTYESDFAHLRAPWTKVLEALHGSVASIQVQVYNSSEKDEETESIQSILPERQIAVGGDLLSRGLTLEGLVVSYFHRSVGAADTMMQMARWFGYRDGYRDLCRLWISEKTVADYQYVQEAVSELRSDLAQMHRNGLTPRDFGIAIRQHPESLLITARNKSRNGVIATNETVELSLLGRNLESRKLSGRVEDHEKNRAAVARLISEAPREPELQEGELGPLDGPWVSQRGYNQFKRVPKSLIADLLSSFVAGPDDFHFGAAPGFPNSALATTVRSSQGSMFQEWDVTFVNGSKGADAPPPTKMIIPGKDVHAVQRTLLPRAISSSARNVPKSTSEAITLWVSGQKTRVAGSDDLRKVLNAEQEKKAIKEYLAEHPDKTAATVPESWFYRYLPRPQLLIYPIIPAKPAKPADVHDEAPEVDNAVGDLLAEATPANPLYALKVALPINPAEIKAKSGMVKYMLNTVAQKFQMAGYEEMADVKVDIPAHVGAAN